jgi:hypothetical protein
MRCPHHVCRESLADCQARPPTNSPFAREVIERIAAVYAIEARIRGLDAGERRAARQAETKPLMEALKARLDAVNDGTSRQSTLIKAIDCMLGFVFNGAIIWAERLPPIYRAGYS